MRIQRPKRRRALTTLNDCESPHTCIAPRCASVSGAWRPVPTESSRSGSSSPPSPFMTLRAAPDLALGPERQHTQLDHLGMVFGHAAGHGQLHRVENLHLRAEMFQDARHLMFQKATERAFAQRTAQYLSARSPLNILLHFRCLTPNFAFKHPINHYFSHRGDVINPVHGQDFTLVGQ
jgi:hypothetical protein